MVRWKEVRSCNNLKSIPQSLILIMQHDQEKILIWPIQIFWPRMGIHPIHAEKALDRRYSSTVQV